MTSTHQFTHTVFAACMLLVFAGSADAGIVKCIDKTGAVTFTDVACNADADVAAVSDLPPANTKNVLQLGNSSVAEEVRVTPWANKPTANRAALALDVATLKAAKASMVSMDRASSLVRQQAQARPKNYL